MDLVLIRHLPTEWNKKGILQGSQDIPILPISEADTISINKNIEKIQAFKPELVIASELSRTQQTAAAYGFNSPLIEPLVNELCFGAYEGVAKKQLLQVQEWTTDPRSLVLGERLIDFEKRIVTFLNKYQNYSRVLVFGHGSWIRGFLSIERVGTVQKMNQLHVNNNELIEFVKQTSAPINIIEES